MTCYEKYSLAASVAQTLAALVTLIIAWKAYQKFLNQKLNEKQLELVIELVYGLWKHRFIFHFQSLTENFAIQTTGNAQMPFYDLISKKKELINRFENYRIVIPDSFLFNFPIMSLLANPLLPDNIAKGMKNMADSFLRIPMVGSPTLSKHLIIGIDRATRASHTNPEYFTRHSITANEYIGGIGAFVQDCQRIDDEILKWLDNHGITEINMQMRDSIYKEWD